MLLFSRVIQIFRKKFIFIVQNIIIFIVLDKLKAKLEALMTKLLIYAFLLK